jgi:hypothetical protein
MRSRLFHAVIAGGFALAAPLAIEACASTHSSADPAPEGAESGGDPSPATVDDARPDADDGGAGDASDGGDAGADAMVMDAGPDADAGWPPTK